MGKAKIISGGTDGRYTIQILTLKTKAEARIDALEEEIDKLRSGEEVEFSPSLYDQYVTLLDLIDQYRDAIEDNRNKENDQQELTQEIALEQQQLETLEDDLSELESTRDEYLADYEEAEYSWEHDEITEDEYLFYQSRYLTAQANVVAKLASIAGQQAVVDALEAEKAAIKFAELDNDLATIKTKAGKFFDYDAKEPLSQLDTHVNYGETIVSHMAQAFSASIEWYNDAEQQNYQDAMDKAEWTEEQYPIAIRMNEAYTEASAAKTARDSAQDDYDEAYVAYIRGDGTEEDMQAAADALSLAQANYSAKLAQYNIYYDQWEALEVQINGCVKIDTDTMKTRLDNTNTEYTVMSQDLASLTAFRDRQELKITSLEKELERLQDAVDVAERTIDAWCADLTEDLEADTEVGTIEISGESDTILVHPGYDGAAAYDQERDGQLQPPAISTAAQAFYNYAMLPGWQRWKPTFRLGTIRSLDGDLATVDLDAAASVAQGLDINGGLETIADVPIDYMSCNGAAFEEGDRVVVKFTDGDWDQPTVIGFEDEPQPCVGMLMITLSYPYTDKTLIMLWNVASDSMMDVPGITFPCQPSYLLTTYLEDHPSDPEESDLFETLVTENAWYSYEVDCEGYETISYESASAVPNRDGSQPGNDHYISNCSEDNINYSRVHNAHQGKKLSFLNTGDAYESCIKWSFTQMDFNIDYAELTRTRTLLLKTVASSPLDDEAANTFSRSASTYEDEYHREKTSSVTGTRLAPGPGNTIYTTEPIDLLHEGSFINYLAMAGKSTPKSISQVYAFYHCAETITGVDPPESVIQYDIVSRSHNLVVHACARACQAGSVDARNMERSLALESAIMAMIDDYMELVWPAAPDMYRPLDNMSITLQYLL